jgi:nucleotidyltransferase/DNA polymerase involved in DNA repair
MENGFDLNLVREYSERQRQDSEKIVSLCNAVEKLSMDKMALEKELTALKNTPAPAPEASPKK